MVPWALYEYGESGRTTAALFLKERGHRLDPGDRAWLEAQCAAWLSVWEVQSVEVGTGLTMKDLLTGASRFVHEQSGSRVLVARHAVLARVVEAGEISVFCGTHPRPLPPVPAAEVLDTVRDGGGLGAGDVLPERLRGTGIDRLLLTGWRLAVEALDRRPLPQLCNTDGDALEPTTDHYTFRPEQRAAVEAALSSLEADSREEGDEGHTRFTFTRPGNKRHKSWENTIVGSAHVSADSLRLETNSRRRAGALRRRVERACGDLILHRSRELHDVKSLVEKAHRGKGVPGGVEDPASGSHEARGSGTPPELVGVLREYKARHYASWVDESIPALGGLTPREAVKTPRGRTAVDRLLKDMENHEAGLPREEQYDFSLLRERLGL